MRAKDLMHSEVITVRENDTIETLLQELVGEHVHGAPVLNENGDLVGVVSQQDVFFGTMTRQGTPSADPQKMLVKDIMTSPPVKADEETGVAELCRLMYRLRIHRVPIVREDKVTGIVSSLDICAAIGQGKLG